jgi:hypothetical protein
LSGELFFEAARWWKTLDITCNLTSKLGPSWSWSYGSWIYNYLCNQCLSSLTLWVPTLLRWGVLDTTSCDKVCQWLETSRWFSPGTPVSSTNKTDRHNITEILLKVALNTIILSSSKTEWKLVQGNIKTFISYHFHLRIV